MISAEADYSFERNRDNFLCFISLIHFDANCEIIQYRIVCRKGIEMAVFKHLSRIFITTSNGYLFVWFVCAIVNVFGLYF